MLCPLASSSRVQSVKHSVYFLNTFLLLEEYFLIIYLVRVTLY